MPHPGGSLLWQEMGLAMEEDSRPVAKSKGKKRGKGMKVAGQLGLDEHFEHVYITNLLGNLVGI